MIISLGDFRAFCIENNISKEMVDWADGCVDLDDDGVVKFDECAIF